MHCRTRFLTRHECKGTIIAGKRAVVLGRSDIVVGQIKCLVFLFFIQLPLGFTHCYFINR